MDSADGFGKDHAYIDSLNFGALEFLDLMGNCVGHHNLERRNGREREKIDLDCRSKLPSHIRVPTQVQRCDKKGTKQLLDSKLLQLLLS